jgi:hypothetical protein
MNPMLNIVPEGAHVEAPVVVLPAVPTNAKVPMEVEHVVPLRCHS